MPLTIQRVIVPVYGDQSDERLIEVVGQLVDKQYGSVTLLYVVEVLQSMPLDAELPAELDRGEKVLSRAQEHARKVLGLNPNRISTELLQARSAGSAIVDEAIERASDGIVLSARVRKRQGRLTLGETVGYILKNATCEVFVVRQPISGYVQSDLASESVAAWR